MGRHALRIDGRKIDTFDAEEWSQGVVGVDPPETDQSERLRGKSWPRTSCYFHRWRPQNETYLFGFRKHEQGNNAVEIPQFDPMVASKDDRIRKLSEPVEHEYEMIEPGAPMTIHYFVPSLPGQPCLPCENCKHGLHGHRIRHLYYPCYCAIRGWILVPHTLLVVCRLPRLPSAG